MFLKVNNWFYLRFVKPTWPLACVMIGANAVSSPSIISIAVLILAVAMSSMDAVAYWLRRGWLEE